MLSSKNESAALRLLESICEDYLSRYSSTLEQDRLALKDENALPMYSNIRNAVIQLRGEKEILVTLLQLTSVSLRLLNMKSSDEIADLMATVRIEEHRFVQQYCENLVLSIWQKEFEEGKTEEK